MIDMLAEEMEASAKRLRGEARRLELNGDLATSASAALREVLDLPSRVRLDFLVTRPIYAVTGLPGDVSATSPRHRG
jgi:hypothetical protein